MIEARRRPLSLTGTAHKSDRVQEIKSFHKNTVLVQTERLLWSQIAFALVRLRLIFIFKVICAATLVLVNKSQIREAFFHDEEMYDSVALTSTTTLPSSAGDTVAAPQPKP